MSVKTIKAYKIRDKTTGLYSSGGSSPKFNKTGKTWSSLGSLKNHLRLVNSLIYGFPKGYENPPHCYKEGIHEIVELMIQTTESIIGDSTFTNVTYGKGEK